MIDLDSKANGNGRHAVPALLQKHCRALYGQEHKDPDKVPRRWSLVWRRVVQAIHPMSQSIVHLVDDVDPSQFTVTTSDIQGKPAEDNGLKEFEQEIEDALMSE